MISYEICMKVRNIAFCSFIITFCSLIFQLKEKIVNLQHLVSDLLDESEIFRTMLHSFCFLIIYTARLNKR